MSLSIYHSTLYKYYTQTIRHIHILTNAILGQLTLNIELKKKEIIKCKELA